VNKKARQRLIVATAILVIAFLAIVGWLIYKQSATYLHVGELSQSFDGKQVEVSGKVLPGSVTKDAAGIHFTVLEDRQVPEPLPSVAVDYDGAAPDSLENPDAFVIVEGAYDDAGRLITADSVKTKCPSKYKSQAESPAAQTTP
jgi:cytochrome c-type biogenesis protein CcmE